MLLRITPIGTGYRCIITGCPCIICPGTGSPGRIIIIICGGTICGGTICGGIITGLIICPGIIGDITGRATGFLRLTSPPLPLHHELRRRRVQFYSSHPPLDPTFLLPLLALPRLAARRRSRRSHRSQWSHWSHRSHWSHWSHRSHRSLRTLRRRHLLHDAAREDFLLPRRRRVTATSRPLAGVDATVELLLVPGHRHAALLPHVEIRLVVRLHLPLHTRRLLLQFATSQGRDEGTAARRLRSRASCTSSYRTPRARRTSPDSRRTGRRRPCGSSYARRDLADSLLLQLSLLAIDQELEVVLGGDGREKLPRALGASWADEPSYDAPSRRKTSRGSGTPKGGANP